ncbi:conserved hypothetical protein [Histoplasma capsulatum G186AR]|uniref:Eisosome protein 1 n=2 Tax=Ajellomyces capsulatus TaxID=5037 RepID=C0NA85_AJECG|nr:uncharacterized protein HCBG_00031 [Histoplasma capsulatum G186AR]EEH10576.1 conserved hypothetical protein [Histoplasma capsulatum G186AR]KAG5288461.1 SMC (structural maintenance of chromosomes) domain-containing protein, conidia-enriched transcript [Histoplasma capsulatum]QSS71036.1 SMC (structural maintenance of chromosomes) domain-containing protein, conidia-enriched transcript [Histoplasma capsulatum G186AR]
MSAAMIPQVRHRPDPDESLASSAAMHVARSRPPVPNSQKSHKTNRTASRRTMSPPSYLDPAKLHSGDRELASAGAAASLAHAGYTTHQINKVETEHPLRNPELTAASCQAASQAGRSQAVRNAKTSEQKHISHENERPKSDAGAMLAATDAISHSRKRAVSAPAVSSDGNHSSHAMTAASASHKMFSGSGSGSAPVRGESKVETPLDARKVHATAMANIRREFQPERKGSLHKQAVEVARQMFSTAPQADAATASIYSRRRREPKPLARPLTLHETAQKLASERLAMMDDQHRAFRDYYSAAIPPRRQRSFYSRFRKRAASDSGVVDIDNEQSVKAQPRMTTLQSRKDKAYAEKRARDHESLMKAARKNADATLDDVDRRIYESTGRSQSRMVDKAKTRTVDDEDLVPVPIGAGQFVAQEEVDRLAKSKTKPAVDDVMRRLEEQRAKVIEEELDEREAIRQQGLEKEREEEARRSIQEAKEDEKRSIKRPKGTKKILDRLSKPLGVDLFRRKSSKARGKFPAKDEEDAASGAPTDHQTQQNVEVDGWAQVPEKQNPSIPHTPTHSAGEASQSILLEPPRESLSRQPTTASNKSQSGVSEKSSSQSKLQSRKKRDGKEMEPTPSGESGNINGSEPGEESTKRKTAPATARTATAPMVVSVNGRKAPDNGPAYIEARPALPQWSSSIESPRAVRERQQDHGGGLSRRLSMKARWNLRLFGKSSRRTASDGTQGSFEVQRERGIAQRGAPATTAGGVEVPPEPLRTVPSQNSSVNTPTNPSKFTENL